MNNSLKLEMDKEFDKKTNLEGIYLKYKIRKKVRKRKVAVGSLSTVFVALIAVILVSNIKEYNGISENLSGDIIINNPSNNKEYKDILIVNPLGMTSENDGARGVDSDLIYEYEFLKRIAEANKMEISWQRKIYVPEYDGQKWEDFSKFQENVIYYDFKDNKEPTIEITFSENKLRGESIPVIHEGIETSVIQNQELQIFERQISEEEKNITGKALFNINGMNFKVYVYDVSHEEFIEIIRRTIIEYKEHEKSVNNTQLKDEITNLYYKATEAASWFSFGSINTVPGYSSVDYNNYSYNKVMDDRFANLEEFNLYLQEIFTDENIKSLYSIVNGITPNFFVDIDNQLYVLNAGCGSNPALNNPIIYSIVKTSENEVKLKLIADHKEDDETIKIEKYYFTVVKDEDKWKFTDFYSYNY